jgi:hypothetical protein
MSMPSTFVLLHELDVCGRAKAQTMATNPIIVSRNGTCVNHILHVRLARKKLTVELTFKEGVDFL